MQKVLLHYFSGTGNSLYTAKKLGHELSKLGYETVFHSIENGISNKIDDYSLHIFFFPVYATAVPHIMLKYIRNLPDGKDVKTAVLSTNGRISTRFRDGYQGWALHQARLYLKMKNYDVFFSDTLDFPHNITIAFPPRKEEYNEEIIKCASKQIAPIAERIAKGERHHRGIFILNFIWSIPFGILYSFFGRRLFGKIFAADCRCNSCKLCVKQCPAKAIQDSKGHIRWKWNCEGCLRCINGCPKHAIQGSVFRAVAIIMAALIRPDFIFDKIIPDTFYESIGSTGTRIFNVLTDLILFVITFVILDWLIYQISRLPAVRKVVSWGYTSLFGRYNINSLELNKKASDKV